MCVCVRACMRFPYVHYHHCYFSYCIPEYRCIAFLMVPIGWWLFPLQGLSVKMRLANVCRRAGDVARNMSMDVYGMMNKPAMMNMISHVSVIFTLVNPPFWDNM